MAGQKVGAGAETQGQAGKIKKVRVGIPPMVRGDQSDSQQAVAFKPPRKPKAKDTLRDGSPKAKK